MSVNRPDITTHEMRQLKDQLGSNCAVARKLGVAESTVRRRLANDNSTLISYKDGNGTEVVEWVKEKGEKADAMSVYAERMEEAINNAKSYSPKAPKPSKVPKTGYMQEIVAADAHLGKLCWAPESGQDYDLNIATERYLQAHADLLDAGSGYERERIKLIIGNDLYHSDNQQGTTARSGNVLDMDGRQDKIIQKTLDVVRDTIYLALEHSPRVDIVPVPGNHCELSTKWTARWIAAWFRKDKRVSVDLSDGIRRWWSWGITGRMAQHGHTGRAKNVPQLILDECPHREAVAQCKQWYVSQGHIHQRQRETFGRTVVDWEPALTSADAWHAESGYTNGHIGSNAYIYHNELGRKATFGYNAV